MLIDFSIILGSPLGVYYYYESICAGIICYFWFYYWMLINFADGYNPKVRPGQLSRGIIGSDRERSILRFLHDNQGSKI